MYVCMLEGTHAMVLINVSGSQCCPTKWVLEVELRLSDLITGAFTGLSHPASPADTVHYYCGPGTVFSLSEQSW